MPKIIVSIEETKVNNNLKYITDVVCGTDNAQVYLDAQGNLVFHTIRGVQISVSLYDIGRQISLLVAER